MIQTLVVFGAGGDLAGRLLFPAVAALYETGVAGPDFRCVGAGPQAWAPDEFARHVRDTLTQHASAVSTQDREAMIAALQYRRCDASVAGEVADVLDVVRAAGGSGPVAVYLALPTQLMLRTVQALGACGLPTGSRVAVEKPFGFDAAGAADLNAALAALDGSAEQTAVYRVDHALAMTKVVELPATCFPGTDLRIDWSAQRIERIELLWEETLALEGRASFYDRAGALRDVVQNHLVQLLCTIAQPRPDADGKADGRDATERREAVLRSVRPPAAADMRTRTRRARYTAGRLAVAGGADGRRVSDYTAEPGVHPERNTETFAEVVLEIDNPRWAGVPFVLRAGKALTARRRGLLLHLRPGETHSAPDGPVWLDLDDADGEPGGSEPAAYQRIVAELLEGGASFAVSAGETRLAWQLFTPVLRAWGDDGVPLATYPAGSPGP